MATTSRQHATHATWIWYPGDFEVWLGNIFNNRRTERGAMFPPFWKQDSHWSTVEFSTTVELRQPETITIAAEGRYNVQVDGRLQRGMLRSLTLEAGQHRLNIKVWNQATPPALFIEGPTVVSDSTWMATYEDKLWIDENGVAHGSGLYVPAAHWLFDSISTPPSSYRLERTPMRPAGEEAVDGGMLYDFGRETFGYIRLLHLQGRATIYYGESREEALDTAHCETLDTVEGDDMPDSKAFRFVYVVTEEGSHYDQLAMDFEYAPHDTSHSGSFRSSDELLNKIWQVSAYTLELTTREFFMDGIKRDRWTWSGDAIQSYLMNYYLHFDTECVKRTIRQLRGKDPVTAHVNTIMDYTFYWFRSVMDYYRYTADIDFVGEMFPRMMSLMDYVEGRTDEEGLAVGQPDDWIFVDWVDFPMHKRGALAFEQILYYESLMVMHECAQLLHRADPYLEKAERVRRATMKHFWDDRQKAFLHALEDGQLNTQVTKFPNMFAILYDFVDDRTKRDITAHVMNNRQVDDITTPYMRFYELETMCQMGEQDLVLREIRDYWGGMLREGATSFWEKYVPGEHGTEHLAMYGRPYGKSLCHAWGASPLYLLGRYFLGIRPTKPGYEQWEARPHLGDMAWMEGDVPTPFGRIHVKMDRETITIESDGGRGLLHIGVQCHEIAPDKAYTFRRDDGQ